MFENIGKKIKKAAKDIFWGGCALSIIGAIILLIIGLITLEDDVIIFLPIPTILLCPPSFWLISQILYGFGELIEKTQEIAKNTEKNAAINHQLLTRTSTIEAHPIPSNSNSNATENKAKPKVIIKPKTEHAPIQPLTEAEKECTYISAILSFKYKDYKHAYESFIKIPGYKDTNLYIEKLENAE